MSYLKGVVESYDPGVLRLSENVSLGSDVTHLILDNHILLKH